ncbi:MAG TPA: ABC transporter ATP-binding protein [Anaerolineae bacterium]|nr:ABC transporter ATP-binding protein [Anaerolineae bacterium]
MLEIEGLHSYYGNSHVLQGVDLSVPEGTLVALMGRNGMGKTTLIRSIMGMKPPSVREGEILYRGASLLGKPSFQIAAQGLGLCPQGRRVFASLTVMEHLTFCARSAPAERAEDMKWNVDRIFEMFPRLGERKRHRGSQLSGGERQMLAIARALMTNPDLLLMDEPSEGLAPIIVEQLGDDLLRIKEAGFTVFLVEQNLGLALEVADDMYILDRGKVVFHGPPEELAGDQRLQEVYLGVKPC